MSYSKIPFQFWRIFWFAVNNAAKAGAAHDPAIADAYKRLSVMAEQAITAIKAGEESANRFVAQLDRSLENDFSSNDPVLERRLQQRREQERGY